MDLEHLLPTEQLKYNSKLDQNPADFTTRVKSPSLINWESVWQKGPEFLYHSFEKWPIKQYIEVKEIPYIIIQHTDATVTEKQENFECGRNC